MVLTPFPQVNVVCLVVGVVRVTLGARIAISLRAQEVVAARGAQLVDTATQLSARLAERDRRQIERRIGGGHRVVGKPKHVQEGRLHVGGDLRLELVVCARVGKRSAPGGIARDSNCDRVPVHGASIGEAIAGGGCAGGGGGGARARCGGRRGEPGGHVGHAGQGGCRRGTLCAVVRQVRHAGVDGQTRGGEQHDHDQREDRHDLALARASLCAMCAHRSTVYCHVPVSDGAKHITAYCDVWALKNWIGAEAWKV